MSASFGPGTNPRLPAGNIRRARLAPAALLAGLLLAAGCSMPAAPPAPASTGSSPGSSSSSSSGSSAGPAPVPALSWAACPPAPTGAAKTTGFACATAKVPMDHADPSGDTFNLALIKHPAQQQEGKRGTIFWNPGGPSDAGTVYLPVAVGGFPAEVRERFDIISWDPRGMGGGSTPAVQCFDNADAEAQFFADHPLPPIAQTDAELTALAKTKADFNRACVQRNGKLLEHVSTADNARDLDLLRQAVGEDTMNYYGTSYGTFLGATYLNMFPDKVRAAVLDGAVFPTGWIGEPDAELSTFVRVGSDQGSAVTVAALMKQCGTAPVSRCAFSAGSPAATTKKWNELLARTKAAPVQVDGQDVDNAVVLNFVQGSIYVVRPLPGFTRFPGYAAVGEFLQEIWQATQKATKKATKRATEKNGGSANQQQTPAPPAPTADGPESANPSERPETYLTSAGRQLSVICGESQNPSSTARIAAQAKTSFQRAGLNSWPFVASCEDWTTKAAAPYTGPWDTETPGPVLVVGNTFDPATAYTSSQKMAKELGDGRFLTVDGFGHTQLLNPSKCAQDHITAYYLDQKLPPEGTRCPQDQLPFTG